MITLPAVISGTKTSTTAAASAADTGLTAEAGVSAEGTDTGGTQGFVSLLGNKLLTLVQHEASGQAATPQAGVAEFKPATPSKLNAMLAALENPEALTALLQPEGKASDKAGIVTADDKDPVSSLSDSDMQTLQALFAMLPPAVNTPAAAPARVSDASGLSSEKGAKQASLASLLASGSVNAEGNKKGEGNEKAGAGGLHGLVSGTSSPKTPADAPVLNGAFQQIASQAGKEGEKENSSSLTNPTLTHHVVSSASAALTPTTTTMVTAPATPQLNAQLGSPEWQQALGQQILMFSRNGQHTAELHLHPQDLGSIQISLKLDNDQAQLSMISNHSQVRAAAEAALPHLRAALAESGINLGQSNVSSDAFQQGQNFNGQQEQQRNSRGNTFSLAGENDSEVTPVAVPASLQARADGTNAVDIFA
uniref:flagellar hook-length control protein FliK n=1 Tax=Pantoea sp. IMH TaxID=1267600 RepID=UPI000468C772|nr:flagellar hook-length control protein FliK [Pantoea sp. IMH]